MMRPMGMMPQQPGMMPMQPGMPMAAPGMMMPGTQTTTVTRTFV
jgi:hypothetical protein